MHLKEITLDGYRSARHGCPIVMNRLGRFNVLVGPNNSGKSTVLRFLEVLASLVRAHDKWPITLSWDETDRSWWWQGTVEQPITATLMFAAPAPAHELENSFPGRFEHDGNWRVTIEVSAKIGGDCIVLPAPNVFINNDWHPVTRQDEGGKGFEYLNRLGQYVSSSSTDACPYLPSARSILQAWAMSTRFYDPVRAIDRNGGRRGLADGSDLLKELSAQQLDQKQAFVFETS
jgi:predicted ATPase